MKNAWIIALAAVIAASCQFNKSVSANPVIGLTTTGDGLSCSGVTLTNSEGNMNRNEFIYGEKLEIHFNDMEGFTLKGREAFPGMALTIVTKEGDTVLHNKDVYADYPDKIELSPLALTAFFTAANPLRSNRSYRLSIHIWDKKGKGTFDASLNFSVRQNPALKHRATHVKYGEIYLFDRQANAAVTTGRIAPEREVFLLFEGLNGFKEENGKSDVVIEMHAKDNLGRVIIDEKDLTNGIPLDAAALKGQIAPNFIIHDGQIENPVKLEVRIYERSKPATGIRTTATLEITEK
jgi:hypothetical protein